MFEKLISSMFVKYIEFVCATSKVIFSEEIEKEILKNSIISSWHCDSFAMNFLLREFRKSEYRIYGVTTTNKRGNYIKNIMESYDGIAIRMPDGIKMKSFLTELREKSKIEDTSLYITLDGPVGPYKVPKKIGASLSNASGKKLLLIKVDYKRKIKFFLRWDKYLFPLPFNKIEFKVENMGVVTKEELRGFSEYKKKILKAYKKELLKDPSYNYAKEI
ncbi:MAG: hypothetical protein ACRCWM_03010 [Sarcina sp.]